MRKEHTASAPAVGGTSLMVIFGVLCLTVFALLSLSTVQADRRLSDRSAEAVEAYYAADAAAEEILSRLRSGETVDGVSRDGSTYTYACPVSSRQELSVCVELGEDGSVNILRWQTVSTADWEFDDSIVVWDGESFGG